MSSRWLYFFGGGVLIGVVSIGAWSTRNYNDMVQAAERADAAWAHVGTVLQRRSDLIPNLVAVTEALAAHERALVSDLAAARIAYATANGPAERVAGAHQLDAAVAAAQAAGERYPQLGSTRAYANLRHELAGSENRIAVERARYNAAVRDYRVIARRFPARLLARAVNLTEPLEY